MTFSFEKRKAQAKEKDWKSLPPHHSDRMKTDPELNALIGALQRKDSFYQSLSRHLKKKVRVNVRKIDRFDSEIVVVPGKVLGDGALSKKVTVYAWHFSDQAKHKIHAAGGTALPIGQLLTHHTKGRILV